MQGFLSAGGADRNLRGTYRKGVRETTAQTDGNNVIPGRVEDANPESRDSGSGPSDHPGMTPSSILFGSSPARRACARKSLANPHRQGVADLTIGLQLLLAIALGAGGIVGRPVFDVGRQRARQFQRLVMRLRRQRDDEVEVEPFPIVEFLERGRLVA